MSGQDARNPHKALAEAMREIGWSQAELARRLGITETTVRNWLAGRRTPPDNVIDWLIDRAHRAGTGPPLPEGWRSLPEC